MAWRSGDSSGLTFFVGPKMFSVADCISTSQSGSRDCSVFRADVNTVACAVKVQRGWPLTLAREAEALRLLSGCAGVPRVMAFSATSRTATLVTAPLGSPLGSPISLSQVQEVCLAVLDILQVVHARGIAHLDVSPDNVVVANRSVYLIDWECFNTIGVLSAFVGKPRFASQRLVDCGSYRGVRLSHMDDIESVLHMADALLCKPRTSRVEEACSYESARAAVHCISE